MPISLSTALQDLFGGKAAEAVLLSLFRYGESYGRAIARAFAVSLDAVQRQLDHFEKSGTLVCKRKGVLKIQRNHRAFIASARERFDSVVTPTKFACPILRRPRAWRLP